MKKRSALYIYSILIVVALSCKKFLEIPPPNNQLVSDAVFADSATATATVLGIYSEMMASPTQFSSGSTTLYTGLSADELAYYTPGLRDEFVSNEISSLNHSLLSSQFWTAAYKYIYVANLTIEKLQSSPVSPAVKATLQGECKFIRALCYFYLINLFGDVPLILQTDYRKNSSIPRSATSAVYDQIIADIQDAKGSLPNAYVGERTRPTKWTAAAFLARVYLYTNRWQESEAEATTVLNSSLFPLSTPNTAFLKTSTEAIWQLLPVNTAWNTWEGSLILPASSSSTPTYLLTSSLINSFEAGDLRKTNWVSSRIFNGQSVSYPSKYKVYGNGAPVTEYYTVFRSGEQYLIRAEARTEQNNYAGALNDLNTIRARAGLPALVLSDKPSLLSAIEKERRTELFAEWGHRWLDLKRRNRLQAVLGQLKPQTWQATDALWPIPQSEISANPTLTQNPGY